MLLSLLFLLSSVSCGFSYILQANLQHAGREFPNYGSMDDREYYSDYPTDLGYDENNLKHIQKQRISNYDSDFHNYLRHFFPYFLDMPYQTHQKHSEDNNEMEEETNYARTHSDSTDSGSADFDSTDSDSTASQEPCQTDKYNDGAAFAEVSSQIEGEDNNADNSQNDYPSYYNNGGIYGNYHGYAYSPDYFYNTNNGGYHGYFHYPHNHGLLSRYYRPPYFQYELGVGTNGPKGVRISYGANIGTDHHHCHHSKGDHGVQEPEASSELQLSNNMKNTGIHPN